MLLVQPEAEARLDVIREYMNLLDAATLVQDAVSSCRAQFEDKLNYLRRYGCKTENGDIDELKHLCLLSADSFPYCLGIVFKRRPDRPHPFAEISSVLAFELNTYVHSMNGGLIWHGPKTLVESDNFDLTKGLWEVHT